ncbi:hypothetical protein GZ77_14895 [Endozoicomonas montiporae]|uniref:Uncharacterized protein n=2 Tax=Endozoicomonas montiporae TaxID=1027273 RepID=A0A081N580_9GAMM|nr:hypothetical protein GZ77_14895 [Endozoicomonas montiporae]
MTPEECAAFQQKSDEDQFKELTRAQDVFITSLRLDLHGDKFRKVMEEGSSTGKYLELSLEAFPDAVKKHYPQLIGEIPALEESQNAVESVAKCFMYGEINPSDPSVLRWRYYRLGKTDNPLVGYVRPDPEVVVNEGEKVPEIGYVTDGKNCRQGVCDFRYIKTEDVKQDAVRLVYRLKPVSMEAAPDVETPTSTDGKKWAKDTSVIKLTLRETKEWFGDPEIYFLVLYYKQGKFIRMDTVDIDWATEKGVNVGKTELLYWKGADQVRLVMKERDLNISFIKVLKFAFSAIKHAAGRSGVESEWLDVIASGVNALPKGSDIDDTDPGDITVRGELSKYHKATYMDDTKFWRRDVSKEGEIFIPMVRGTRMEVTSTLYSDVETFSHPVHDEP